MLPKSQRFSTNFFQLLFRKTKRWKKGPYTFLFAPVKKGEPRYAVVVGKKFVKSAVERNRIRRQVYAQLDHVLVPQNTNFHVICLYNTDQPLQDTAGFASVLQELKTFLHKQGHALFSKQRTK